MKSIEKYLHRQDIEFLRVIANYWGIESQNQSADGYVDKLVQSLSNALEVEKVIEELSSGAKEALRDLVENKGKLPISTFEHRYGKIRNVGVARLVRDKPYKNPESISEELWYRGMIVKDTIEVNQGLDEYIFFPKEIMAIIPLEISTKRHSFLPGRPATPEEKRIIHQTGDRILDILCTFLALRRSSLSDIFLEEIEGTLPVPINQIIELLQSASILDKNGLPSTSQTKLHLESPRLASLTHLFKSWFTSETYDDLELLPDIHVEGYHPYSAIQVRKKLIDYLQSFPKTTWWNVDSLIKDIYEKDPDLVRNKGEYESWLIKSVQKDEFLNGFEHWMEVEGYLIRYWLTVFLPALGLLDTARAKESGDILAIKQSKLFESLVKGSTKSSKILQEKLIHVDSKAHLLIPADASRTLRYQVARFSEWLPKKRGLYHYVISPASMDRAKRQGLNPLTMLKLIAKHSAAELPPNFIKAIQNWEKHGTQAKAESLEVLRVTHSEIIQQLRSGGASKFLGEQLNPVTIVVQYGAWEKVMDALAEMGYLGESSLPSNH
ncbi:MAG: hypothetical protein JXA19_07030 [Anaerolineales bacterium]|nr:hypothetical protein [Anaerolineales bacterium]